MATADRQAEVRWDGALISGSGTVTLVSSGAGTFPVTWPSRVEKADGRTSPEELLAAAHASCFAMAFSATLGREAAHPEHLEVSATVSLNPKDGGGFKVTDSALTVRGVVPGIDQNTFAELAAKAKDGCPISGALMGNVNLSVEATLIQ